MPFAILGPEAMKKKTETRADLARRVKELTAQLASTYHFAAAELHKAGQDRMMASGVLLQLHALGGREIIAPVVIRDGLSAETIAAIRADIVRSYQGAVELKPKGAA
jgi:hypothetical protein